MGNAVGKRGWTFVGPARISVGGQNTSVKSGGGKRLGWRARHRYPLPRRDPRVRRASRPIPCHLHGPQRLEDRHAMAGDVVLTSNNGVVALTGDAAANAITIDVKSAPAEGSIGVSAGSGDDVVQLKTLAGKLQVFTLQGGGDDLLEFDDVRVLGSGTFDGGRGDDRIRRGLLSPRSWAPWWAPSDRGTAGPRGGVGARRLSGPARRRKSSVLGTAVGSALRRTWPTRASRASFGQWAAAAFATRRSVGRAWRRSATLRPTSLPRPSGGSATS